MQDMLGRSPWYDWLGRNWRLWLDNPWTGTAAIGLACLSAVITPQDKAESPDSGTSSLNDYSFLL